ncbi:MAG: TonB-dependent receptor [Bacteroidales bacterium]|nr:TonB-dependent receptor [Bacteroidales bacterium]
MKSCIFFLALLPIMSFGQQNYTISGKITDAETGEDLIGATVKIVEPVTGVATNSYGFYSISLPEGKYVIRYSYIGYEDVEREINFSKNYIVNIELTPAIVALDEIVVSSDRDDTKITSTELGVDKLNLKDIDNIPVIFGEKDILKTIQLLPGISNSSEGSTGFNVRGGSMGQNLILLDEAPIYSAAHLAGFFSIFNSDAIKDVTVFKGGIPACYGGRASSVLDIKMNNGNNKKFSSSGGIGLVSSRLTFEAPLIKDKMSFIISGRRTYADLIARLVFPEDIIRNDIKFYFYDFNAKLNYSINQNNRLFLSGYFGKDVFEFGSDIGTAWGNTTATIRWNHIFNEKLFSRSSIIYSNYDYEFIFGQASMKLRTGIQDMIFKEDATWYINPAITLKFGTNITYHKFMPGEIVTSGSSYFELTQREKRALESAVYIQNEQKITPRFNINYGLRLSTFNQFGPGWFYDYADGRLPVDSTYFGPGKAAFPHFGFEPRIIANYILNEKTSVKLSYNRLAQYLHLLSNTTSGSPADVWMPCSNNIKPVYVDHFSTGLFRNFLDNNIESSIEVYYKNMANTVDYKDGADIIFDEHVESQILSGKGRSYGLELYIKKKYGTFTGWVSYTLSRSENKIEGINNFSWYPVRYDKTHEVSLIGIYKISQRLTASGVWTYATGNAVTFPSGKYIVDNNPVPYYTERNGYRMPDYHRLDLSLTLNSKKSKKYKSSWDFSVYNAYNRYNAYIISFRESETVPGATEAVKLSLFGIVPSITYKFKF